MNPSFWRNKNVFLTGHTGFKGSWLSIWLQSLGANLTGYALPPSSIPSLFEEGKVYEGMYSILGDIRDFDLLKSSIQKNNPEIIIHMAAQPLVRESYRTPVETYSTNVMGTVYLMEAIRLCQGIKSVVNVTTDKCYENQEWLWGYREIEALGGKDPYSSSKACSEIITAAYRSSYFQPNVSELLPAIATARAGNVIGGGDWSEDRLIPDILRSFENNKAVQIRNPDSVRPWQHVLEPLRGYLVLSQYLYEQGNNYAEAWNFGPSNEDSKPVAWIVEEFGRLWGSDTSWQLDLSAKPHEASFLKLDNSKSRSRLDWSPILNLQTSLKLVAEWNKNRNLGHDVRKICEQQINDYHSLLGTQ